MNFFSSTVHSEFILGGQKSGKSAQAEMRAREWLDGARGREAVLVATAQAWDNEMRERIARHQRDRAGRVPGLASVEEPYGLAEAIQRHASPRTLVVVDCLTLWLTNLLMPLDAADRVDAPALGAAVMALCNAVEEAPGPVVLVSNEIGLGVIPLGSEVRGFVDTLGRLNQAVAARCKRVTLMAAGLPLTLKGSA
jgi:adenosylcobinamide kinase/adenosylcobinamide-phosphate guanylyltransferase